MALSTEKLISHIEKAAAHMKAAKEEFAAIERMTIVQSYMMGHMQAAQAVIDSAREFVKECGYYAAGKEAERQKQLPPSTGPAEDWG